MNKRLAEAARRIFGNLPHSDGRSGNKVLRKNLIGHKIAAVRHHRQVENTSLIIQVVLAGVEWSKFPR